MRQAANTNRLGGNIRRALNKIRKPSTADEITEFLNRDLDPGDPPFQVKEVSTWLQDAPEGMFSL